MNRATKYILRIVLFVILTVLTQVGGIALILGLLIPKPSGWKFRFCNLVSVVAVYLLLTYLIVPWVAPFFGRVPVANSDQLEPASYGTILLNRHYVDPALNDVLRDVSDGGHVNYLDANFPFFDGFPLLPHLSHNDGKKIDLSFVYVNEEGQPSREVRSNSGYGVFEEPEENEVDQPEACAELGYVQYSYPEYLTLGKKNSGLQFSEEHTRALLLEILKNDKVEKVFLEPHLVLRMNLDHPKIRYHGCHAVRHDDHIHIQIK